MRSLTPGHADAPGAAPRVLHRRRPAAPRDPAPSRMAYRLHRLWLTPIFRAVLMIGLPAYIAIMSIGLFFADADRRAVVAGAFADLRASVEERPEFMVTSMVVEGASDPVEAALMAVGPALFPISTFHLDLEEMRAAMEAFDAVKRADLRVVPGGVLEVRVLERAPAIIWRSAEGLELLDDEGSRVALLTQRAARPDLAMIAGEGAERAVPEALVLLATAAPLGDRVRGLERIGARRWDVVLTRGQRVMLPEDGAVLALERALALDRAEDVLERDVAALDMRNARRPTLRLNENAMDELRRIRALERGARTQ
jgi:cell division protein FtsQ